MKSRTDIGWNDDGLPIGLWHGAVKKAVEGRRGQAVLREILTALLAMPVKELAFGELYDGERCCVLGVLALSRAHTEDEREECALRLLGESDEDAVEISQFAVDHLGMAYVLAYELIDVNDQDDEATTPSLRWQQVVAWIQHRLHDDQPEPTMRVVDALLPYPDTTVR